MKLTICRDYSEVSQVMAQRVLSLLEKKPDLVFCLPAGNSPIGMYRELVKAYEAGKADFSGCARLIWMNTRGWVLRIRKVSFISCMNIFWIM